MNKRADEMIVEQGPMVTARIIKDTLFIFFEGPMEGTIMHVVSDILNQFDSPEGGQIKKFALVLNSGGGDPSYLTSFCSFAKEMGLVSVYGIGQASSAALGLLLECKKNNIPVYIDPLCHVVLHRVKTTWIGEERYEKILNYNEKWVKRYEDIFDNINRTLIAKLDAKTKKQYKNGDDVYLLGVDLIKFGIFDEIKKLDFGK